MAQLNPFSCTNCEEIIAPQFLFKCEKCTDDLNEANSQFEYFCDSCILVHTMKGHKITNGEGQQPTVCEQHGNVHLEYCKTCDVALCCKCLRNHSKHDFEALDLKAFEIRADIMQYLERLEKSEEPATEMKESAKEIMDRHRCKVKTLCKYIEQSIDGLKLKILREIKQRFADFEAAETKIENRVCELVDLKENLRSALSMPDVYLVGQIADFENKFKSLMGSQGDLSELELNGNEFADVGCLDELNGIYEHEAMSLLNLPNVLVERAPTPEDEDVFIERRFIVGGHVSNYFEIVQTNRGIRFSSREIDDTGSSNKISTELVEKFESFNIVEKVYCLSYNRWKLLILMQNKTAQLFDVEKKAMTSVEYPFMDRFLWPYVTPDSDLNWSYWDCQTKKIRFTHNRLMEVPCEEKPFINMSSSIWNTLCFFDAEASVIIRADIHNDDWEEIPLEVHGLQCLDSLSCYGHDVLILWSIDNKSITILLKKNESWIVDKKLIWFEHTESIYTTLSGTNCSIRFLPALDANMTTRAYGSNAALLKKYTPQNPIFAFLLGW